MYDSDALIDDYDDALSSETGAIDLEDDDMLHLGVGSDDADDMESDDDDDDGEDFEGGDDDLLKYDIGDTWSDDPIRMYLTQMGEIPLLTRQREISLAKQIEVTRRKFRAKLLECDYVLQHAVRTLGRVHQNDLPFDRTVQVSVTDSLEKQQIIGRFPHNLKTLHLMMRRNCRDYLVAMTPTRSPEDRQAAWKRLARSRRRAVRLIEELGLRTQRIENMIATLDKYSKRVDELRAWIREHKAAGLPKALRQDWIVEYRQSL